MIVLDASGKPTAGLLEGSTTLWGNHRQCLDVRVADDDNEDLTAGEGDEPDAEEDEYDADRLGTSSEEQPEQPVKEFFRGQYCVVQLKPWLPRKPRWYGMNTAVKTLASEPPPDSLFADLSSLAVFFHLLHFRLDLCVPSTCTRDDIQRVASYSEYSSYPSDL